MKQMEENCSDKDKKIIKGWYDDNLPENEFYEKSLNYWETIPLEPDIQNYNGSDILDRIHHKIRIEESYSREKTHRKTRFIDIISRIAAVLFIPLLIASLYFNRQYNSFKDVVPYSEIFAPYGTRTNFCLPDGTKGWLNGGSSLKFPVHYSKKVRNVQLTGEAYFDVVSNKKPFTVSTENIDVEVFGTSFNIMAYDDEQITEVTLERGKVEVFRKKGEFLKSLGVLNPNESCIYDHQTDSGRIVSVNSTEKMAWLEGKLTFKYETFEEVIRKINRRYNVDIVIKDEILKPYIYYGTFKDETLDEVLKLLQLTAPLRFRDHIRERDFDGSYKKRKVEIFYKRVS